MKGLTQADFQIFDNGKRQEIVAVTEYQHERAPLGPEIEPPQIDVAPATGRVDVAIPLAGLKPGSYRLVMITAGDAARAQQKVAMTIVTGGG